MQQQIASYGYPVQGEVLKKYAPKYASDTFFCQLLVPGSYIIKAMIHESHYAKFDIGDVVGVDALETALLTAPSGGRSIDGKVIRL